MPLLSKRMEIEKVQKLVADNLRDKTEYVMLLKQAINHGLVKKKIIE